MRVEKPDGNTEDALAAAEEDHPVLLRDGGVSGRAVDDIGDHATCWAKEDVKETEHGGPSPRCSLRERVEVLEVVCAEDGVNGKLTAEGAGVWEGEEEVLEGERNLWVT